MNFLERKTKLPDEIVNQGKELGLPDFTHAGGDPNREAILRDNYEMREGIKPGPRNFGDSDGFGRVELRIPEFDYPFIRAMFPDIASPDAATRHQGWKQFCKSPLSEKYKVGRKRRGPVNGGGKIRVA